jgi:hypothetical protein
MRILLLLLLALTCSAQWLEDTSKRTTNSRTYQQGEQRQWSGRLTRLHYESVLDSGTTDAEIDMTPQHVTAGGNDRAAGGQS